jgi:uncharacterized membrane protein YphA (DoxX/SURF4 family)
MQTNATEQAARGDARPEISDEEGRCGLPALAWIVVGALAIVAGCALVAGLVTSC